MLTQEAVLEAVKAGRKSRCIDSRDHSRLIRFFPETDWLLFGFTRDEGAPEHVPVEWTEENIKKQLASDVAFGFSKALGQRGISASLMNDTIKAWMWVMEDPLQDHTDYAQYGLPLLKLVAVKYGFPNEIGDDDGDEYKYACD